MLAFIKRPIALVGAIGFASTLKRSETQNEPPSTACTHNWVEDRVLYVTTCTTNGSQVLKCTECNEEYEKIVEAYGHDLKEVGAQEATCIKEGWNAYVYCTRTDCSYTTYTEIPSLGGHEYENGICKNCGYSEPTDEHSHAYTMTNVTKEATCEESGSKTCICECGDSFDETIPALGHNIIFEEGQAATCVEAGWNAYERCSRAGCEYSTYESIPATGHTEIPYGGKEATCTENGAEAGKKCSVCNKVTLNPTVIEASHTFGEAEVIIEATCKSKGQNRFTCSVCGDTKTEMVPALKLHRIGVDGTCVWCGTSG